VGVASSTLAPFPIVPAGTFLISGPPSSGRSTALLTMASALRRGNPDTELYCFTGERSPLADHPIWTRRVLGPQAAADEGSELAITLGGRFGTTRPVAIFIEGLGEYSGSVADLALQSLVKQCLADGHLVLAEGESSTLVSLGGLVGQLKSGRSGLALAPDPGDGPTIFKTPFPRLAPTDLLPGRGLLVGRGRADLVQLALPPPG
jgi:S-DNA-T family DNA segregation ATPase FtsK/SpoIIIE